MKRVCVFFSRGLVLSGVVASVLLASASVANAVPVTEMPANDDIATAFGPLAGDVAYTGQFESLADVDWLYLYAQAAVPLVRVQVTKVGAGCSERIRATLRDAQGEFLRGNVIVDSDTTAQLDVDAPPHTRMYVMLQHDQFTGTCIGDPYAVTVGPATAVTAVAPPGDEPPVPAPQPTSEPNGDVATAWGPLAPSTAYGGDFASPDDRDWLVFYTARAFPTRVLVTKVGSGCSPNIVASVRAASGALLASNTLINSNTTARLMFAPSAAGRFYVALGNDCAGDPYQVRVGPSDAVTATSALIGFAPTPTPAATGEPNDTPAQAVGLTGGTAYGAAIDAGYDVDFFRFGVAEGRRVDVSITKVGEGCSIGLGTSVRKAAAPATVIAQQGVGRNATIHYPLTASGATDYLLRITGACAGDPYQLRVDPADAVVPPTPPDGDGDGKPDDQDRCPTIAADAGNGCPAKVKPRGMRLVLVPRRDAHSPFRFRAAGSVRLPAAVPSGAGCRGRVAIRFRARGRSVGFATTRLRPDCKYGRTFTFASRRSFGRARGLNVTATFRGNALLRSATRAVVARIR